jgi:hypothetical protein
MVSNRKNISYLLCFPCLSILFLFFIVFNIQNLFFSIRTYISCSNSLSLGPNYNQPNMITSSHTHTVQTKKKQPIQELIFRFISVSGHIRRMASNVFRATCNGLSSSFTAII